MGHLHGTFAAGMYEPLVSTTVDLQMLIEEFKIKLGTFMTACKYVDCDEILLEEAGIVFEPVSSGSSGGEGEMCIPEGPLMSDPRSRRRVIRSVTHAYTRHADELGIPPADVPSEVGALNQEVISRFRRTPLKLLLAPADPPLAPAAVPLTVADPPLAPAAVHLAPADPPLAPAAVPLTVADPPLAPAAVHLAPADPPLAPAAVPYAAVDPPLAPAAVP
ncbi:unnamed protein product [Closterium sp. NIES-64]|nr:unnamed protein product [Closterium sp. NIES-64]